MKRIARFSVLVALLAASETTIVRAGQFDAAPPLPLPPGVAVFFNPRDKIEDRLVELIHAAKQEILVNQYVITSKRIAAALVEALQKRRVMVGIILEAAPAVTNYQTPSYFRINDVPVLVVKGDGYNNNKYLVIDRQVVVTGSYDCTNAAASRNDENVLVITDASIAVAYYNNWVAMAKFAKIPEQ